MYNESSGTMYEYEEEEKQKRLRKKKILIRRIVSIIVFSLILAYFIILLIDINRYKNGSNPLITLSIKNKEYDDGYVKTYYSIGWVFREYNRETIKDDEMVPIWSSIRMDNVLNRVNEKDLPAIEMGYDIPKNELKKNKVDDVLFFYDKEGNLLDTYKCILSEKDCEIAYSIILPSDIDQYNAYQMGIIDNRYVFITEYKNKDTEAALKYVYLYDIAAKKIIAKYEDIRYSILENEQGFIDSSKYIIKKNGKWGIDQVIKGSVSNVEDYLHDAIKFDSLSKKYIFMDDNMYYAYDANKKTYTNKINEDIATIYVVNDKIYMKTMIRKDKYSNIYYYKLYNSEGINVLNDEAITFLEAYDNFLIYTKEKQVFVIDYDGNMLIKENIPIYFENSIYSNVKNLTITITNNILKLSTPKENTKTHYTDEFYYDITTWKLTKKRTNVKETIE